MIAEELEYAFGVGRDEHGAAGALSDRYARVREATERLAAPLSPEDMQLQSMADASPTKWHLAHTSWFFETFVLAPAGAAPFHPRYGFLFNSYYESVGARHARPERGMLSRPSVDEVRSYRAHVDEEMHRRIEAMVGDGDAKAAAIVELGLHHEQQHQELLLTDALHALSRNPLRPAYAAPGARAASSPPTPLTFTRFEEGIFRVGHAGTGFAFDNESPEHRVFLHAFALADRLTTNGEFAAFVEDGGYERPELWLSEGWSAREADDWRAPIYWEKHGEAWHAFSLAGLAPLDHAEPVCHLSYFEADAFARWADARLPTEFEWERAAQGADASGNLLEQGALRPIADAGDARGPRQLFGDVWEWTASAYAPYPGFAPAAGALGEYNGKFMVNQQVLRGGSFATSATHLRASYRNFFPASARWQFAGLRLAR